MAKRGLLGAKSISYLVGAGIMFSSFGCNYADKVYVEELEKTISSQNDTIQRLEGRINTESQSRETLQTTVTELGKLSKLSDLQKLLEEVQQHRSDAVPYIARMDELESKAVLTIEDLKTLIQDYRKAYGNKDTRTGMYEFFDKVDKSVADLEKEITRAEEAETLLSDSRTSDLEQQAKSLEIFRDFYLGPVNAEGNREDGARSILVQIPDLLETLYSSEDPKEIQTTLTQLQGLDNQLDRLYETRTQTRDKEGIGE